MCISGGFFGWQSRATDLPMISHVIQKNRSFSCAKLFVCSDHPIWAKFSQSNKSFNKSRQLTEISSSLAVKKDHPSIDCDVFQNLQLLWLLHNSGFSGCGNPQFPLDHTLPSRNPCRPCHCIPLHPHYGWSYTNRCVSNTHLTDWWFQAIPIRYHESWIWVIWSSLKYFATCSTCLKHSETTNWISDVRTVAPKNVQIPTTRPQLPSWNPTSRNPSSAPQGPLLGNLDKGDVWKIAMKYCGKWW